MAGGFNRCKICNRFILSQDANYCSSHCRDMDVRLYYSKVSMIITILSMIAFLVYAVVFSINIVYIGLTLTGTMLLVLIPLYQYHQSIRIEQKIKTLYHKKTTIETEDGQKVQPVYIYLYISRYTEESMYDEDFSEFA